MVQRAEQGFVSRQRRVRLHLRRRDVARRRRARVGALRARRGATHEHRRRVHARTRLRRVRIHYVVRNGGTAANVVPGEASVEYLVRAPERDEVERVSEWVRDVAEAAAKMTRTEVEATKTAGMYGVLPNHTIADAIRANMERAEFPLDDDQRAFAGGTPRDARRRGGRTRRTARVGARSRPRGGDVHPAYRRPGRGRDRVLLDGLGRRVVERPARAVHGRDVARGDARPLVAGRRGRQGGGDGGDGVRGEDHRGDAR
nr:peptidase dimerization domain-containing protein [Halogeometricum sp. CBA1124]